MNYRFLRPAFCEFELIKDHYDAERQELGTNFVNEFFKSLELVIAFPRICPLISKSSPRCNLKRFPYFFVYRIDDAEIVITAVTHNKRKPGSWKKRKRKV